MWLWLRNTASRGRCGVPASFLRIRSWIRVLISSFVFIDSSAGAASGPHVPKRSPRELLRGRSRRARLARLLLEDLAHVADALLLVRVRLAQAPDLRRHLAHLLAVDAGDRHAVGLRVHRDLDPGRDREHDRMRVAE